MEMKSKLKAEDVEGRKIRIRLPPQFLYLTITKVLEITDTYILFIDKENTKRMIQISKIEELI